ncbi:MAG: CDP-alcohol phosphatidyltransferase family protein [Clostridiales bacterium]|jgi:CDP-diacylglycerol--glycerol-3-phosphate 3-phosphatidyltransferase|nr:CDP-alcohol phosphatidyltransferase family protein [Clostridiales bacterium]
METTDNKTENNIDTVETKEVSKTLRNLPNFLSWLRLILSVTGVLIGLIHQDYIRWIFVAIFVICIISDIADGKIARHFKICTDFGSKIDGIADLALTGAVFIYAAFELKVLSPDKGDINLPIVLILFGVFIAIKAAAGIVTRQKFGKVNFMHTILMKITGGSLMACALVFIIFNRSYMWVIWVLAVIILLAFVEELVIVIYYKDYDVDRKGFLFDFIDKKKQEKKDKQNNRDKQD